MAKKMEPENKKNVFNPISEEKITEENEMHQEGVPSQNSQGKNYAFLRVCTYVSRGLVVSGKTVWRALKHIWFYVSAAFTFSFRFIFSTVMKHKFRNRKMADGSTPQRDELSGGSTRETADVSPDAADKEKKSVNATLSVSRTTQESVPTKIIPSGSDTSDTVKPTGDTSDTSTDSEKKGKRSAIFSVVTICMVIFYFLRKQLGRLFYGLFYGGRVLFQFLFRVLKTRSGVISLIILLLICVGVGGYYFLKKPSDTQIAQLSQSKDEGKQVASNGNNTSENISNVPSKAEPDGKITESMVLPGLDMPNSFTPEAEAHRPQTPELSTGIPSVFPVTDSSTQKSVSLPGLGEEDLSADHKDNLPEKDVPFSEPSAEKKTENAEQKNPFSGYEPVVSSHGITAVETLPPIRDEFSRKNQIQENSLASADGRLPGVDIASLKAESTAIISNIPATTPEAITDTASGSLPSDVPDGLSSFASNSEDFSRKSAESQNFSENAENIYSAKSDVDPYAMMASRNQPALPELPKHADHGEKYVRQGNSDGVSGEKDEMSIQKDVCYKVVSGDSYWSISEKFYGTGAYFRALAQYNTVVMGAQNEKQNATEVFIPDVTFLRRCYASLCPYEPPTAAQVASARQLMRRQEEMNLNTEPKMPSVYVTCPGDTLSGVALYQLGSASRWAEVYEMNRDKLGSQFGEIPTGTQLKLPESAAQVAEGVRDIQR